MRKIGVIALVLAVSAVAANAAIYTTQAQGALQLTLRIDKTTGLVTLYNNTGADVASDGYEIWSTAGKLKISGNAATGWISIGDVITLSAHTGQPTANRPALAEALQAQLARDVDLYPVSGFSDVKNIVTLLSEATLTKADPENGLDYGGEALYSPGLASGWTIGKPVGDLTRDNAVILADMKFYYIRPDSVGNKFLGNIEIVPEPATMAFLAIGGALMAIRRRR